MSEPITFYESRYYMFSNFSSFQVEYSGVTWPTSEHAYQGNKFNDPILRAMIRNLKSAHLAMKVARSMKDEYRDDWDKVKVDIMRTIVWAKITQHGYIRRKLLETGDAELIESSPTDSFWGWGPDKNGENHLGKIWMWHRRTLMKEANLNKTPLK